jgi:hypothetical protein
MAHAALVKLAGSLLDDFSAVREKEDPFVFGDSALNQIACNYCLASAGRCHKEELGDAAGKLTLYLLDSGPLELVQDDAGDIILITFGRRGICFFDRAAKPIFF